MSSRRKLRPTNPASMEIRALDGTRVPGGCWHCDAYQEIRADYFGPDLHSLAVVHDDWCPWFTAATARER